MLGTIFMLLYFTSALKSDESGVFFEIEENRFLLDENTVWNGKVESLMACSQICARQDDCNGANFMGDHGSCSLLPVKQTRTPKKLLKRDGYFYLQKVGYQDFNRVHIFFVNFFVFSLFPV